MTADGCGIADVNLPQHSIKWREKSGLVPHGHSALAGTMVVAKNAKAAIANTIFVMVFSDGWLCRPKWPTTTRQAGARGKKRGCRAAYMPPGEPVTERS